MGYTITAHGVIRENDETGTQLYGGSVNTILHGAALRKFAKEILVDMVDDAGVPFADGSQIIIAGAIPPEAFDVWLAGRVIQDFVTDPTTPTSHRCGVRNLGGNSEGDNQIDMPNSYFGFGIPAVAGGTWGLGGTWDSSDYVGGADGQAGDAGSAFRQARRMWWPIGGDVCMWNVDGYPYVSGQVRLVIFYSLITPPTS